MASEISRSMQAPVWESKGIRGEGREERHKIVMRFLGENRFSQSIAEDVANGALKTRLIYAGQEPTAVFAHTRKLETIADNFPEGLRVKVFSRLSIDPSGKAQLTPVFTKLLESLREEKAVSVAFHVRPHDRSLGNFLTTQECEIIARNEKETVMARRLDPASLPLKRKREDEPPSLQAPQEKREKIERPPLPITLRAPYIRQIQQGLKTIEGRINSGQFRNIPQGRVIKFFGGPYSVLCEVTKLVVYKSFREMLEKEGFKKCVNEAKSLEDAVRIYDSIPSFKERAAQSGVVAIHLKLKEGE